MTHKTKGRIGKDRHPTILEMIAQGRTAGQIGDHLGVDHETVRKFARRRGLKINRHDMTMENHPMWTGGTTRDRQGYELRRVSKDGPYGYLIRAIAKRGKAGTDSAGYAPVHRIVMHDKLGRRLLPNEVVDHIDGDLTNNDPQNLRVFSSNALHLAHTLRGKVPNWSAEGRKRMTGRPPKNRQPGSKPEPIADHPKSDDQA